MSFLRLLALGTEAPTSRHLGRDAIMKKCEEMCCGVFANEAVNLIMWAGAGSPIICQSVFQQFLSAHTYMSERSASLLRFLSIVYSFYYHHHVLKRTRALLEAGSLVPCRKEVKDNFPLKRDGYNKVIV